MLINFRYFEKICRHFIFDIKMILPRDFHLIYFMSGYRGIVEVVAKQGKWKRKPIFDNIGTKKNDRFLYDVTFD